MNTLTAYSLLLAIIFTLISCFIVWDVCKALGLSTLPGVIFVLISSPINNYLLARNLLQSYSVK